LSNEVRRHIGLRFVPHGREVRTKGMKSVPTLAAALLCALLSGAQHVWAQSWPASVTEEKVPVHQQMDPNSQILTTLIQGTTVTVYFELKSWNGHWCKIALQDDRQNFGFVYCSQIRREKSAAASLPAANGSSTFQCQELVSQLMEASGANAAFSIISPEFIAAAHANAARGLGPQERADLLEIIQRNLDGSVLAAEVHQGLLNRCEPANYVAALEVFRGPLAAQMVKLEAGSGGSTRTGQDSPPASQERIGLIRRLDRAQGTSQFLIELGTVVVGTTAATLAGDAPRRADMDSMRAQMAQQMRPMLLSAYLAIYRSVSNEDLEQYVSTWETHQSLRRWDNLYKAVFRQVMEVHSTMLAKEVKAYLQSHRFRRVTH
jgi:hypothetical protein